MPNIIIGSRGSKLALWQANWVKSRIEESHPGLTVEIEIIKTTGDKQTEASLAQIGGKGVFTKEIEDALLDRRIDLAVHSLKDLPTALTDGLHIAAIAEREDVRDALLVGQPLAGEVHSIKDLPHGAQVGTSSLRRRAQLLYQRPDLQISELRGNVDTRLRKLDDGQYDAIILASAGLIRLGLAERITAQIDIAEMLTAVGQGALGIETRIDDQRTNLLLDFLNHWPTRHATEAERAVLRKLGGGCAVPIAAFGRLNQTEDGKDGDNFILDALVCDIEGKRMIRKQGTGHLSQAEEIGAQIAQTLIEAGARELLPRIGAGAPSFVQTPPVREHMEIAAATAPASYPEEQESDSPKPLNGCRVILTRSIKQSGEFSHSLSRLGAEVVACPTIEIREPSSWEQMDHALQHLNWYDWLAFTSTNGVEFFLRRLDEMGHGRAELMSHRICAVGRKTAEKLRNEKITVDLMPERFTAEALVEEFIKQYGVRQRLRGARMLLPASQMTRDVIRPALAKVGVQVDVVEAYQTIMPSMSGAEINLLIRESNADYIIFTSPSTVTNLSVLLESDNLSSFLANTRIACIGPITAEAARSYGLEADIQPEEHTGRAIVDALVADFSKR